MSISQKSEVKLPVVSTGKHPLSSSLGRTANVQLHPPWDREKVATLVHTDMDALKSILASTKLFGGFSDTQVAESKQRASDLARVTAREIGLHLLDRGGDSWTGGIVNMQQLSRLV